MANDCRTPNLSKVTRVPPTTFKIPTIPHRKYLAYPPVEGKSLSTKCDNLLSNCN